MTSSFFAATATIISTTARATGITSSGASDVDLSEESLWLNGSVYSAIASINGLLPIHASAVAHDGRVFAFTGPAGAGKSTLVAALASRGLPMFCDDTLVLDLSDPERIICLPGHKRLKLRPGCARTDRRPAPGEGLANGRQILCIACGRRRRDCLAAGRTDFSRSAQKRPRSSGSAAAIGSFGCRTITRPPTFLPVPTGSTEPRHSPISRDLPGKSKWRASFARSIHGASDEGVALAARYVTNRDGD